MRQGQQHRRGRGRNNVNTNNNSNSNNNNNHPGNRKGQNPLTRSFESNGPDVKVRGTPAHVAEKYMQLARDAQSTGDHVLAENYLQHAEHYNRIILAYREQQVQQSGEPVNGGGRPHQGSDDGTGDDMGQGDDGTGSEQPAFNRHSGERDFQPSLDEARPQQQFRQDQSHRFRDRPPRQDRQDGYERGDRPERQGGERGFDRHRDRQFRNPDQPGEARDMRMPREPRDQREFREPREPREPRAQAQEHREFREPRELQPIPEPARVVAPPAHPAPPAPPIEAAAVPAVEVVPPARPEAAPRRRERFGLGADQPEFLRRPVRRPRRDPDQDLAPEAPPALPPADEPPRE